MRALLEGLRGSVECYCSRASDDIFAATKDDYYEMDKKGSKVDLESKKENASQCQNYIISGEGEMWKINCLASLWFIPI